MINALGASLLLADIASAIDEDEKKKSQFADKEHLGIYLNKNVANLYETMDASDQLSLLYIYHPLKTIDEENGQDWGMLDLMFSNVLEGLGQGYVNTYAVDCASEHPDGMDEKLELKIWCEREVFEPVFRLYKPPEIRSNPYTGKHVPVS